MKVSLFYLIHPAKSNSRENSGILTRFPCFMFNSSSAYCVTGETVETTTDQRNPSIIGRDNIYFFKEQRRNAIYLFI